MRIAGLLAPMAMVVALAVARAEPPPPLTTLDDPTAATLARLAVTDDDFYRPVLYTWTPADGIAGLRERQVLLTATATSGSFVSPFNRALAQVAGRPGSGQLIAQRLATDPRLIRRRYAWPAPFATVLGLGRRRYGTALVRIELRAEAWIGRFEPGAREPFHFVDRAGAPVALADVAAAPERIGAIFHVRVDAWQGHRYREYVVCNDAMIAAWSIATPEIADELAAERALVAALAPGFAALDRRAQRAAPVTAWTARRTDGDLLAAWHATLAFANERYRAEPARLRVIDRALADYEPAGPPLTVTPSPSP